MYPVILASGSPRRKEILEQVGIPFVVMVSNKEELITKEEPSEIVQELALRKAADIAGQVSGEAVIIGADTVVVKEKKILGKPKDEEEAYEMLSALQNQSHFVYTGVAVLIKDEEQIEKQHNFFVKTKVTVAPMTKEEIKAYIATGEPMDKAGAYAIQGRFAAYIQAIEGDYYNVVGLPIAKLHEVLSREEIYF